MSREGYRNNDCIKLFLNSYIINVIYCYEDISSLTKVGMRKTWQRLTSLDVLFPIQTFCSENEAKIKFA
jgi:hypothetical protein